MILVAIHSQKIVNVSINLLYWMVNDSFVFWFFYFCSSSNNKSI